MRVPIGRAVKAAAFFNGLTDGETASKSGIPLSRVRRIQRGEIEATNDELQRLLSSTGVYDLLLTEGQAGGLPGALSSQILSLFVDTRSTPSSRSSTACRVSIDRLAFTFDAVNERRLLSALRRRGVGEVKPGSFYRRAFQYRGVRISHDAGMREGLSSRIEFNPNETIFHREAARSVPTRQILDEVMVDVVPEKARLRRVDVAVDLPVSIFDVQLLGTRARKFNSFIGPLGLETVYCGSKWSGNRLRIYDRRRKLLDDGVVFPDDRPILRVESQQRPHDLFLVDLLNLKNPFRSVGVYILRSDGLPLHRRLLVEHARFHGLQVTQAQLPPRRQARLLDDLKRNEDALGVPHPADLFDERWPTVARRMLRALAVEAAP